MRRPPVHGFKVLIDVDDVLHPCHERVCALASEVLGYFVDPHVVPPKLEVALGDENAKRVWDVIDQTPGWCAPPIEYESLDALLRLRAIADEVVAVTSPHTTGPWMTDRQRWLKEEAGFKKDDIIQTSGKYHVPGAVLIDDLVENHEKWRRCWPGGTSILMTASHNKSSGDHYMIARADGWEDVVRHVIRAKMVWRRNLEALEHG